MYLFDDKQMQTKNTKRKILNETSNIEISDENLTKPDLKVSQDSILSQYSTLKIKRDLTETSDTLYNINSNQRLNSSSITYSISSRNENFDNRKEIKRKPVVFYISKPKSKTKENFIESSNLSENHIIQNESVQTDENLFKDELLQTQDQPIQDESIQTEQYPVQKVLLIQNPVLINSPDLIMRKFNYVQGTPIGNPNLLPPIQNTGQVPTTLGLIRNQPFQQQVIYGHQNHQPIIVQHPSSIISNGPQPSKENLQSQMPLQIYPIQIPIQQRQYLQNIPQQIPHHMPQYVQHNIPTTPVAYKIIQPMQVVPKPKYEPEPEPKREVSPIMLFHENSFIQDDDTNNNFESNSNQDLKKKNAKNKLDFINNLFDGYYYTNIDYGNGNLNKLNSRNVESIAQENQYSGKSFRPTSKQNIQSGFQRQIVTRQFSSRSPINSKRPFAYSSNLLNNQDNQLFQSNFDDNHIKNQTFIIQDEPRLNRSKTPANTFKQPVLSKKIELTKKQPSYPRNPVFNNFNN